MLNKIRSFFNDPFWDGFFSVFTFGQTGLEPLKIESPYLKEDQQLAIIWKNTWLAEKASLDEKKSNNEIDNEQYDNCMKIIDKELARLDALMEQMNKE
jgi:hypothetical protein